jgi:hypothetical protein
VLDDFADGLSGRARRSLSSRMRGVVERRRDARDAERYRSTESGATVIAIPALPPELAALSEALVAPSAQPDVAPVAAVEPKIATTAKKSTKPRKSVAAPAASATPAAKKATMPPNSTVKTGAKRTAAAKQATKRPGQ